MKSFISSVAILVLLGFYATAKTKGFPQNDPNATLQKVDKQYFIENKGQWHPDVLYLARMGGLDAWITKYGVNYTFYRLEEIPTEEKGVFPANDKFEHKQHNLLVHRVLMKLQNYNPAPVCEGKKKQTGYYNYFIGNDPSKHASQVGLYKEAVVKNVYEGIDLRYYFDNGSLRYDYIVHPGADPSQIVFKLAGSDKTYVNAEGNLVFTTRFGDVQMAELRTYQADDKKNVQSAFVQKNGNWAIAVENYDTRQTLIIDPLIYSTYIGGSEYDRGASIALDSSRNAYVSGFTFSPNYDVTPGAFQDTLGGNVNIFVTKLNATGTDLIYSTYIGGSNNDFSSSIVVDGSGNAYITGYTSSTDYDITTGTFQTTHGGGWYDVIAAKLNDSGTALIYSTYIGGSDNDYGTSIAVDGSGNAYITGYTSSTDYDTTAGAFQTTHEGYDDVFVTKLNATGNNLIYSTYIGGSDNDNGYSIAVDGSGNAYITGKTSSTDYDTTAGAFQTTLGGGYYDYDAFVTKLNAAGNNLIYSTYIGGSDNDNGYSIAVDGSGNAYVTGYTESTDYDTTTGAFQTTHGGGAVDVFVTKLNAAGNNLIYSTYIGGSDVDCGNSIAVDGSGNAYVTGYTMSIDYDTTAGAFQTTLGGGVVDVFVTKLNAAGNNLIYSTYIGGSDDEEGVSIIVDGSGNAYVTGYTKSTDYDITSGAFQTTHGGNTDVFVTKLNLLTNSIHENNDEICNLVVYPNPVVNYFTVTNINIGTRISVFSLDGKFILSETATSNTHTVTTENLSSGIYIVQIESNNRIIRKKLVINK